MPKEGFHVLFDIKHHQSVTWDSSGKPPHKSRHNSAPFDRFIIPSWNAEQAELETIIYQTTDRSQPDFFLPWINVIFIIKLHLGSSGNHSHSIAEKTKAG